MRIKNTAKRYLSIIGFLLSIPVVSQAAVSQWQIIADKSQLTFTGTQNNALVSGEFKVFTGTILGDANDLKNSSIDIVVDVNSITLSYVELKTTLMSADWFNTKLFPKAEFKSISIEKVSGNKYQAKGILTIRDKSAPVTLNFSAEQSVKNQGIVIGNATIKRTLFGVGQGEWASTHEVRDEVLINFKVVGIKK